MNIVLIGMVEFSLQMLKTLVEKNVTIAGVVTSDDSGVNSDYADLVPVCIQYNIPVLLTNDINAKDTVSWIKNLKPDVIFCVGWSRLIKGELLQLPPVGVIGYHPAALPKNRGRHPLIWALILGLKKTSSTFFVMDEGADSGDIVSQKEISISNNDDANSLYIKMIEAAKEQILSMVFALSSNQLQRMPQDNSIANVWRKRGIKDGEIDWRMCAKHIHNLVRGLTHPYVGAHFLKDNQEYKVWKTKVIEGHEFHNIEPGKVINIRANGNVILKCADACIELLEVEPTLSIGVGDYL